MGKDEKLPRAPEGKKLFVDGKSWNHLVDAVNRRMIILDPSQFDKFEKNGETYYRYRAPVPAAPGTPGASSGRFVPYVGGEDGTTLYLSPGCVVYCRVEEEDPIDDDDRESEQVRPIYPMIDGVSINAEDPPGFSIGSRSNASIWLITDRTKCPGATQVPSEEDDEPERLEIYNRGEKPPREDGKRHTLIASMDFETASGGAKSITNLDQRWQSDWQVWFKCFSEESEFSSLDLPTSSDVGPSDETDEASSSGGDSKECPWAAAAAWANKKKCYEYGREALVIWQVSVGISTLFGRCASWKACARMLGGDPRPYPGQSTNAGAICVPITGTRQTFGAAFYFPYAPDCEGTVLDVWIEGTAAEDESEPDECCYSLPVKQFPDRWPHHCGRTCSTVVPP